MLILFTFWLFGNDQENLSLIDDSSETTSLPVVSTGTSVVLRNEIGITTATNVSLTETNSVELAAGFYMVGETDNNQDGRYGLYYDEVSGVLTVLLHREPLANARLAAEAQLQAVGFTTNELCAADVVVMTNEFVNRAMSGIDVGFSFCPGSVLLQ